MKNYLAISLLCLVSLAAVAQSSSDITPFLVKAFANSNVDHLQARTSGGSIHVSGSTAAADIRVEVYVEPNNGRSNSLSKEEIQRRLDEDYEISISVANNKIIAIAKSKDRMQNWKLGLSISFKIFVPQNVSSDLGTSGGSIHLANLSGTEDFETSGGSLHIDNLSGKITGRTSGGSIHVFHTKEEIDLSTSGGSIEAGNCTGKIKLSTSGGSLKLNDLNGTITAATSGGSVHGNNIDGDLITHTSGGSITLMQMSGSLDAYTSGGSINAELTGLGKYVKLRNSGGHIDLQLPKGKGLDLKLYGDNVKTDMMSNFSGSIDKNKIDGKLNGGGIPVDVDAGSGRVYVSFK